MCLSKLRGLLDDGDRRRVARELVARIRSRRPRYEIEDFLRAFRLDPDADKLIRHVAKRIGFDGSG